MDTSEFTKNANAATKQGESLSTKLGKSAEGISKKFVAAFAGIAGLTLSLRQFLDVGGQYETAMAKVKTIMDDSVMGYDDMSASILKLSKDTGVAATELAESVYSAISGGVTTDNAVAMV